MSFYQQALEELRKTLGQDHHGIASMLVILASLYSKQDRFDEAVKPLEELLSIREKTLGEEHSEVVATMVNDLAALHLKLDKLDDSES